MKWRPFRSGVPYTCQDCPAYAELQAENERLKARLQVSGECEACDGLTWNYYNEGCAAPCHVCRRDLHIGIAGRIMVLDSEMCDD